jgi:uncharacterized protein YggE
VRFDLKDRTGADRDALKRAVADARSRGEAAASAANVTVDRVLRIEEQRAVMQDPRPMMMMRRELAADSAQSPIVPGELEIRAVVTLTLGIR